MNRQAVIGSVLFGILSLMLLFPLEGRAQEDRAAVRLWVQATPFISGEAGTGQGAPDYTDAFDTGLGFGGEFSWRFCRWFSAVGGIGYEVYDGDTYEGIAFDDLDVVPVYAGGKFHMVPGMSPWDLYLRLDVGAANLSSVDIRYGAFEGRYWNSSWVFLFDVGVGTEYRWGPWGVSVDVKARYLGAPDSALGNLSDADAFWTLPVVFGLNYHF
ncbi:MAG: hypothetical protein LJE96_13000 [Deltaproteobacteria bacterium]|nr:hypothetical protein [Deltaproteobacteria bacterium]